MTASVSPKGTNAAAVGQLATIKEATLVGVLGFSGSWKHNIRTDAEALARQQLQHFFEGIENPWCVSGATDMGVPKLAYDVAEKMGLTRVGVTAKAATAFPLASLHHLVIVGNSFGDESQTFVDLCDVFLLIGGGAQSENEAKLIAELGKPITIVRGLGGVAESLQILKATYIDL